MRVAVICVLVAICCASDVFDIIEIVPETTEEEPANTEPPGTTAVITEESNSLTLDAADALCPAGYYSPLGFMTCLQCEKGTYSSVSQTISSCALCAPGKYTAVDGSIQCSLCPAGTFSYFDGSSTCTSCPPWTGGFAGSSVCVTCSSLTSGLCVYADQTSCPSCASACALCGAGYYNDGSSAGCTACGAGKYSSIQGAWDSGQCNGCAQGTYTKRLSSGMTSCLLCSAGWPAPSNADYDELRSNSTSDVFMCRWSCIGGFSRQYVEPLKTSTAWVNSFNSLKNSPNLFGDDEAAEMIALKYNYCCYIGDVGTGQYLAGCSKTSNGVLADCAPVSNAHHIPTETHMINKCSVWECNDGYYRLGDQCIAQSVCDAGFTYGRRFDGSLNPDFSENGITIPPPGKYVCVLCPTCTNGAEAITACNSTHSPVCRLCGNGRFYSVNGGPCIANVPYGYRPVKSNIALSTLQWGQRPVMNALNALLSSADTIMFYYYTQCHPPGDGRSFVGNDEACTLTSSQEDCTQCNIQCKPWVRTGSSWFIGEGFYGSDPALPCSPCQFNGGQCSTSGSVVQFLNMSTCGPTQRPQCQDCPAVGAEIHRAGWATPTDPNFNGRYPCRVLCDTGFSEVDDGCVGCPGLPLNVKLTGGCTWECQQGYLRSPDGTQCNACPPPDACAVGFYSGFTAVHNVCRSCLGCTAVPNAAFVSNGMDKDPGSCSYRCNSAFYNTVGSCAPCSVRTCISGSTFLKQCTPTSDAECVTCKQCLPGQRVERICGSGNDTVCSACDPALLPSFASWGAVGCESWACNQGYWLDGSVCRGCSAAADCALGFQLVDIPQCVSSSARGKCDVCPTPPTGQCFSGAANCGLKSCTVASGVLRSITPLVTSVAVYTTPSPKSTSSPKSSGAILLTSTASPKSSDAILLTSTASPKSSGAILLTSTASPKSSGAILPTSTASPKSSGAILPTSTTQRKTATVTSQTPPPTSTPIAYATVASLTIDSSEVISSVLLADLVIKVSQIVCLPDVGLCEVSVLSITVDSVTTFCINGVCPGYARRRLLELKRGTDVNLGIISKAMVPDFTKALSSVKGVVDIKVEPNAPVMTTEQLAQLKDARVLVALVSDKFTVFNIISAVSNGLGVLVLVAQVVIGLIILSVVLCCCLCCFNRKTDAPLVPPGSGVESHSQFPALDSIRISKENYKPYVKTV